MLLAVDDPSTWPADILALCDAGLEILRADQRHREDHDQAIEEDRAARFNFPDNPHQFEREQLAADIGQALASHSVMGWHGTRLCQDEVEKLRSAGVHLLSPETLEQRVRRRVEADDLQKDQAAQLIKKHSAASDLRKGQFWCVFTRKTLGDYGMTDLFGMWGGEALYGGQYDNPGMEAVLRRIGKARIIEIAAPVKSVKVITGLQDCMVRVFKAAHSLADDHRPECSGHVFDNLKPDQVLRVISEGDPEFAALTASQET